ncbi:septum formation protein [Clostridium cavendishii DSM 21758]|uniref:dTTP/UTP pyrophosphatase n=1 Tax=Clostridium cavendishii DSM 21758 TaxID=1121302 RepID=A0A1M6BL03_9CLOT|nr:Maf-like protein [Clostridium cavendishii]SHI49405.1 septum formation protein [Clostridium cavendishii DSM 21758]
MHVVLASKSPRRKELLSRIVKEFEIRVSDFDESTVIFNCDAEAYVEELSRKKAETVAQKLQEPSLIIAADTIVVLNGEVLGKPKTEEDAFFMLSKLSGKTHEVYSGVTVINTQNNKIISDAVCTKVKFSILEESQIEEYIKTSEPMDKAGAYGIQGLGAVFVEEIKGCYYNVVGLPLNRLNKMLSQIK